MGMAMEVKLSKEEKWGYQRDEGQFKGSRINIRQTGTSLFKDTSVFLLYYFYILYLFIHQLLIYARNYDSVTLFGIEYYIMHN